MIFTVTHQYNRARAGTIQLSNQRTIETPVFMPVGTQATVKTLDMHDLKQLGARMILCNAYHLFLRPGSDLVAEAGGLSKFMHWDGGIITDSGGFQVFSLPGFRKILENGVEFVSHLDGSKYLFTPESNMDIQHQLGADIIMALDVCVAYPASVEEIATSVDLTTRWASRCHEYHQKKSSKQSLFAIIQGGIIKEAREKSVRELTQLGFPGYGIGGLSVGEGPDRMSQTLAVVDPLLPEEKPRYLMGVGTPLDLWAAVAHGVDMLDCAMPTRIARNGTLFTSQGRINLRNAAYARDWSPPDAQCTCPLCTNHSRAYLRHLFMTHEITALRLSTLHNVFFMLNLSRQIRTAIQAGCFSEARNDFVAQYTQNKNDRN